MTLDELTQLKFNMGFYELIDKEVQQYLKNGLIKKYKPNLVVYYINCKLYDIVENYNSYEYEGIFESIERSCKSYVYQNYTEHQTKEEEIFDL
jgi:hypothetical protein